MKKAISITSVVGAALCFALIIPYFSDASRIERKIAEESETYTQADATYRNSAYERLCAQCRALEARLAGCSLGLEHYCSEVEQRGMHIQNEYSDDIENICYSQFLYDFPECITP